MKYFLGFVTGFCSVLAFSYGFYLLALHKDRDTTIRVTKTLNDGINNIIYKEKEE